MDYIRFVTIFSVIVSIWAQEAVIEINTKKPAYYVSDKFISFSIDAQHLFGDKTLSPENLELARMLSPAFVRISGLPAMQIGTDDWKKCNAWMKSSSLTPVVALDYETSNWHPREIIEFLGMSREAGVEDCVWQLGQRMNTSMVGKYSEDILTFDHMIDVLTSGGRWGNWRVAAGDLEFEWDAEQHEMRAFFSKIAPKVNVMPMRSMPELEEDSVEYDFDTENEALRWAYSQRTEMWLSRPPVLTALGNGCCESCIYEGLRYAKSLGDAARNGYDVILQDVKLSTVSPNMEFFISLLHKQLMGSVVLDTITTKNEDEFVHFYTHCTANASSEMSGSITIFGINMDEEEISTVAKMMHRPKEGEILEYILQVRNNEMLINDEPANMNNQPFPHIRPIRAKKPITLTLPPRSVGFWIVPANSKACIGANNYARKYSSNKIFKLRRTSSTNLLEELILESLNKKQYKFVEELYKSDDGHNMQPKVLPQADKPSEQMNQEPQQDYMDNQIACRRRIDDVETRQYKTKRPLSKLMPSAAKETQEDISAENNEKQRAKRDLNNMKKSLYKHTFEYTKNAKKPTIPLLGGSKKNTVEPISLFQNRENDELPTGDVYAGIGKGSDYDYVEFENSEESFSPTQFKTNEPQYLDEDDDYAINDQQDTDAYLSNSYRSDLPEQANFNGDFVELGTMYGNLPQEKTDYTPGNLYNERYRYPRSIREKRVKREPIHIMNNNNGISCHNAKSLLSKRKQKLYKNGNQKKWMLKKCYESDGEKNDVKHKNHEENILNNEIVTKVSETNEIRSKRSLKSKRKGKSKKASAQYKGQKVKRQAETSSSDAQANKHVKSFPFADDKIITKFAEHPGIEIIKSNLDMIKDTVDKNHVALQNHLKDTKEKTEKALNLPPLNLPIPDLITLKPIDFSKGLLDVDLFNKDSPIERILPKKLATKHKKDLEASKNKLNTPPLGSTMLKSLPALDTQSLTEKIHNDIEGLKAQLSAILDSKKLHDSLKIPGLAGLEKQNDRAESHNKRDTETYQPTVEIKKPRNKRKPLFVEHKEKMEIISQKPIDENKETEHSIQKREIDDLIRASSAENMIFSNSIEHENDEDSAQSSNEIAHEIIIVNELNNTENPEMKDEEAIIIRDIEGDKIETEQILLSKNENKTLEEMGQANKLAFSANLIDNVAHKITHFVTYLHNKIKHWWS